MTINFASPLTGAAVTGLTSPTYTLTNDTAPSMNGKQYAVTALGGTQTGVDSHSVSKPFTITFFRPQVLKSLPQANLQTGIIKDVPTNNYKLITRKGMLPAAGQVPNVGSISSTFTIPAGSDSFEPAAVKAMLSAHVGALWAEVQDICDALITGVI